MQAYAELCMRKKRIKHRNLLNGKKISEVLKTLPDSFSKPDITIGELKDALSGKAYGILLLVLAIPNLIPFPAPGLSAVLGAPLILVTFQLMLGMKTPWLPKFISSRSVKCSGLKRTCNRILPYLEKLEYIIGPRLTFLVGHPADRLIALLCVILSLMIMLPVPFGNALPALAICFFALAILQRDGLLFIFGIVTTLIAAAVISIFIGHAYLLIIKLFGFE